jgi:putative zinc finger protein
MNITCRQIEEWLFEFVSGELPDELCQHVQIHLRECPPCVVLVETYQVTITVGKKLNPRPMPATLESKLNHLLEQLRQE